MSRRIGMDEKPQSRCAVGLLTWNGARDVVECARSLLAQTEPELEIIWIDNASTDSTIEVLRKSCPQMPEPDRLPHNIGFCGGHNRGISRSKARYYFALNQDAFLAPDYLERLCDWLDGEPELAMVSGLLLDPADAPGGEQRIHSAGVALGRGRFPFELGMRRVRVPEDSQRRIVPGVTGAAMVLRRSALEAVADAEGQVFSEQYFAYYEEIDLALRLNQAGFKCGVDGQAVATHAARGQGGRGNAAIRRHYFKNFWLTILRNSSPGEIVTDALPITKAYALHILPQQISYPLAAIRASLDALVAIPSCVAHRRRLEKKFPGAIKGRREVFQLSRRLLEQDRSIRQSGVATQTDSNT